MSQKHRFAQVTFLVALWIALGCAFHLSTHAYQLVGIPLFVGFQLLVRNPSSPFGSESRGLFDLIY
jgi:hypothetical protein